MNKIECLNCKSVFYNYLSNNRKFCCRKCYDVFQKQFPSNRKIEMMRKLSSGKRPWNYKGKVKLNCKFCEKVFEVKPYREHTSKYCSLECRSRANIKCGSSHPNWKGGLYKTERRKSTNSYQYKEWRKQVLMKDNYTCVLCNKREGRLEADHIKMWSRHPESRLDINNGRTLCYECHKKVTSVQLSCMWKNQHGSYLYKHPEKL